jgi:hypothetical protein
MTPIPPDQTREIRLRGAVCVMVVVKQKVEAHAGGDRREGKQ